MNIEISEVVFGRFACLLFGWLSGMLLVMAIAWVYQDDSGKDKK